MPQARFGTVPHIFVLLIFLTAGCGLKHEIEFSGKTMGTIYHIKIVTGYFNRLAGLKEKIENRLKEINRSMSTYIKDSEISRFNASGNLEEKFYVSDDFLHVMKVAERLYKLTDGAWDGTVKPLVNLWGFGSSERRKRIPKREEINRFLTDIGFDHIEISENSYIQKRKASISLDFASIAKGYAVDQLAKLIQKNGSDNFLVEIGGEVFASGFRKDGQNWRVGINSPQKDAPLDQVYKVVTLHDKSLATSGDYRIFFEIDNKRFSHVIDPRTGYPVSNGIVSVSIVADTCTFADGLATAIMVLGHEKGLELVERLNNVECLIVAQKKDGPFTDYYSNGFKRSVYASTRAGK